MLCSHENLLFNNIGDNMLVDIGQLHCFKWVRKYPLEKPFKCDNVSRNFWSLFSREENLQNFSVCFVYFWFK